MDGILSFLRRRVWTAFSKKNTRICISKFGSKQFIHYSNKPLANILYNFLLDNPAVKNCRLLNITKFFVVLSSGTVNN